MINRIIFRVFLLTSFAVIFISCSRDINRSLTPEELAIFPPPPDTTRVQYLTSINISTDIKGKQSAFKKFMFGEEVPKPIIKPYGITMHDSKIYICDTGLGGLILIDLAERSFDYFIPSGKGELQLPLNSSIADNGFLFVADGNRRQVVVFDGTGKYVSELGESGENFKPTDVSVSTDKIFVVSVKDQKVFVYDINSYQLVNSFPDIEPDDDGYLYQPTNLYTDQNYVYVSDLGDNRIKVFSHEGKYIRSVGGYGSFAGQLMRPKGVTVDNESNLYVADAAFENVQIFNSKGNVLMFFGGPYKRPGDMWLPADVTVSYTGLEFYRSYVNKAFNLKYLIFVTNQYGPDKVNVYGFVETIK